MPPARRRRSSVPLTVVDGGPPIQRVSEGRSKKVSICIYGEPGIGKTRNFPGTCPEIPDLGRTLILRPPVDHTDSIKQEIAERIDEWVLRDWAEADDAVLYCRNDGAEKYDWVWLDSISLWQDQGLDDIWNDTIERKPQRKQFGLDKPEYGVNMLRLGLMVRHMVGCPDWNFGVTAHPRITASNEDEEDPNAKLMPWVQGKMMAPKVCGYMNIVGYYHWEEVGRNKTKTRVLSLNSTDKFYAKDQFDSTPEGRLINPTMVKLWEGIAASRKYKKASKAEAQATEGNGRRTNPKRRRRATAGRK